jgi:hypothetical protein
VGLLYNMTPPGGGEGYVQNGQYVYVSRETNVQLLNIIDIHDIIYL